MRQNGFWKGFFSALVLAISLYGVTAYAGGRQITIIDNQARMADALVVCAQELREMNDKGVKVKMDQDKPFKLERVDVRVPEGVEVKTGTRPIDVKQVTTSGQTTGSTGVGGGGKTRR